MSQASTWQRRKGQRLTAWSLRRWLILLLMVAFSTSGLDHFATDDHSASAAWLSSETASVEHASTGEQSCAGEPDEDHGATCCTANLCSFCAPLPSSAAMTRTAVTERFSTLPDELHHGLATSPGLRPPSLLTDI